MKRVLFALHGAMLACLLFATPGWGYVLVEQPVIPGPARPNASAYYVPVQQHVVPASPGISVWEAFALILGAVGTFLSIMTLIEVKAVQRQAQETKALVDKNRQGPASPAG